MIQLLLAWKPLKVKKGIKASFFVRVEQQVWRDDGFYINVDRLCVPRR